jgi:CheY-like chemotaxis protein
MQLLIVEDQPNDLRIAVKVAEESGYSTVEGASSSAMARNRLEKGLAGEQPLPDAILLDLDLGFESGFEVLRYWHSEPRLFSIPLVVWSILGGQYREICTMFRVRAYVNKGEDISLLRSVLSGLAPGQPGDPSVPQS